MKYIFWIVSKPHSLVIFNSDYFRENFYLHNIRYKIFTYITSGTKISINTIIVTVIVRVILIFLCSSKVFFPRLMENDLDQTSPAHRTFRQYSQHRLEVSMAQSKVTDLNAIREWKALRQKTHMHKHTRQTQALDKTSIKEHSCLFKRTQRWGKKKAKIRTCYTTGKLPKRSKHIMLCSYHDCWPLQAPFFFLLFFYLLLLLLQQIVTLISLFSETPNLSFHISKANVSLLKATPLNPWDCCISVMHYVFFVNTRFSCFLN